MLHTFCALLGNLQPCRYSSTRVVTVQLVLLQIELRNLQPALEWVDSRRDDLAAAQQGYEAFEFQLHRLQFLRLLAEQGAPRPSPLPHGTYMPHARARPHRAPCPDPGSLVVLALFVVISHVLGYDGNIDDGNASISRSENWWHHDWPVKSA